MAPSSAIVHSSTLIRVGRKSVRTTGAPFAGPVRRPGRQGAATESGEPPGRVRRGRNAGSGHLFGNRACISPRWPNPCRKPVPLLPERRHIPRSSPPSRIRRPACPLLWHRPGTTPF